MSVRTRGRVYNSAEARERINDKIRKGSSARHSFFRGENTTRAFRMCFYPLISPHSLNIRTATADGYSCVCVVTCHRPVQSQRRADGRPCCLVSVCCAALRRFLPAASRLSQTNGTFRAQVWILFCTETIRGSVRRFPPPRPPYLVFQCVGNSPVPVRSRGGDSPLSCCCC